MIPQFAISSPLRLRCVFLCLIWSGTVTFGFAAPPGEGKSRPAQSTSAAADEGTGDEIFTPEREAAAVTFAKRHHPELAQLLESLKKMDSKRYDAAIQDLFVTSERLAKIQSRTPDRYAADLKIWKLDSRIRLLAAQSVAGMPEARRAELKQLLLDRHAVKVAQLETDRAKLAARLEKLDESIGQLRDQGDELADKEIERLLKSVKTQVKAKAE